VVSPLQVFSYSGVASARVTIKCIAEKEYFSKEKNDNALNQAYASVLIESGENEIINRSYTVSETEGGYIYKVKIIYLAVQSINMG
jgi:hypothetical protein